MHFSENRIVHMTFDVGLLGQSENEDVEAENKDVIDESYETIKRNLENMEDEAEQIKLLSTLERLKLMGTINKELMKNPETARQIDSYSRLIGDLAWRGHSDVAMELMRKLASTLEKGELANLHFSEEEGKKLLKKIIPTEEFLEKYKYYFHLGILDLFESHEQKMFLLQKLGERAMGFPYEDITEKFDFKKHPNSITIKTIGVLYNNKIATCEEELTPWEPLLDKYFVSPNHQENLDILEKLLGNNIFEAPKIEEYLSRISPLRKDKKLFILELIDEKMATNLTELDRWIESLNKLEGSIPEHMYSYLLGPEDLIRSPDTLEAIQEYLPYLQNKFQCEVVSQLKSSDEITSIADIHEITGVLTLIDTPEQESIIEDLLKSYEKSYTRSDWEREKRKEQKKYFLVSLHEWSQPLEKFKGSKGAKHFLDLYHNLINKNLIITPEDFLGWHETIEELPVDEDEGEDSSYQTGTINMDIINELIDLDIIKTPDQLKNWFGETLSMNEETKDTLAGLVKQGTISSITTYKQWETLIAPYKDFQLNAYKRLMQNRPRHPGQANELTTSSFVALAPFLESLHSASADDYNLSFFDTNALLSGDQEYLRKARETAKILDSKHKWALFGHLYNSGFIKSVDDFLRIKSSFKPLDQDIKINSYSTHDLLKHHLRSLKDLKSSVKLIVGLDNDIYKDYFEPFYSSRDKGTITHSPRDILKIQERLRKFPKPDYTISSTLATLIHDNKIKKPNELVAWTRSLNGLLKKEKSSSYELGQAIKALFVRGALSTPQDLEKKEAISLFEDLEHYKSQNESLASKYDNLIRTQQIPNSLPEIQKWLKKLNKYKNSTTQALALSLIKHGIISSVSDIDLVDETLMLVETSKVGLSRIGLYGFGNFLRMSNIHTAEDLKLFTPVLFSIKTSKHLRILSGLIQYGKSAEDYKLLSEFLNSLPPNSIKTNALNAVMGQSTLDQSTKVFIDNLSDLKHVENLYSKVKTIGQSVLLSLIVPNKDKGTVNVNKIKALGNNPHLSRFFELTTNTFSTSLVIGILSRKISYRDYRTHSTTIEDVVKGLEQYNFVSSDIQKNFVYNFIPKYRGLEDHLEPNLEKLTRLVKGPKDALAIESLMKWKNFASNNFEKIFEVVNSKSWEKSREKIIKLSRFELINKDLNSLIKGLDDVDDAFDALKHVSGHKHEKIIITLVRTKTISSFDEIEEASSKIQDITNPHQTRAIIDFFRKGYAVDLKNLGDIVKEYLFIENSVQAEIVVVFNNLAKSISDISKFKHYIKGFDSSKQKNVLKDLIESGYIKTIDNVPKYKDILSLYSAGVKDETIAVNLEALKSNQDIDYVYCIINGLFYNIDKKLISTDQQTKILQAFWEHFQHNEQIGILNNPAMDISQKNRLKESIGFNLLVHGTDEVIEGLIEYSLTHKNKLALFLSNNLVIKGRHDKEKFKKYKDKIDQLLEYQSILPTHPPTKEILEDNTFKAYIYFGEKSFYRTWESNLFRRKEYRWKKEERDDEYVYVFRGKKRRKGGKKVNIEVIVPKSFNLNNNKVFDKMSDPTVDYIQYVGHAGGRNQLSTAIESAQKMYGKKIVDQSKIFVGQACWSFKNYAPAIKRIFPYSHYIGTKDVSNVVEGQNLFEDILNGVLQEESWRKIYKRMKRRPHPFEKTANGKVKRYVLEKNTRGLVASNYVMPDDLKNLDTLDSDGDGIPDSRDRQYNLIASEVNYEETCSPSMPGAIEQPKQSLIDQVTYINQYLEKLFKYSASDRVPFVSVDLLDDGSPDFRIAGWYSEGDDTNQNLVKINRTYTNTLSSDREEVEQLQLEISFNHRFMKSSPRALIMMAMKEIYEHLYKTIDMEKTTKESKDKTVYLKETPGLTKGNKEKVFYLSMVDLMRGYHLQENKDKRDTFENLFLTFKEKYSMSPEITFDMAFQFVWSKKYAGNKEVWSADPDLRPLHEKYEEYKEKLKKPSRMKNDENFEKYTELLEKKVDKDSMAQHLACESLMKKLSELL